MFTALVERYSRLLRAAIIRTSGGRSELDAEEVEQEAKIRIWKALRKGRSIDNPAAYLYRVAVNTTLDALRGLRSRKEEALEPEPQNVRSSDREPPPSTRHERNPEEAAATSEAVDRALSCLQDLAVNRRRAVGLHLQGFSTREIGELLDWTEAKARNLVYRGLNDLRQLLRAEGIEYEAE